MRNMRLAPLPICLLLGCQDPKPAPVFPVQRYSYAVGHYVAAQPGECDVRQNAGGLSVTVRTDQLSLQCVVNSDGDIETGYGWGYDVVLRCLAAESLCSLRETGSGWGTGRPGGWGVPIASAYMTRGPGTLTVTVRGVNGTNWVCWTSDGRQLVEQWRGDGIRGIDVIDFGPDAPVPVDMPYDFDGDGDLDLVDFQRFQVWAAWFDGVYGLLLRNYAAVQLTFTGPMGE